MRAKVFLPFETASGWQPEGRGLKVCVRVSKTLYGRICQIPLRTGWYVRSAKRVGISALLHPVVAIDSRNMPMLTYMLVRCVDTIRIWSQIMAGSANNAIQLQPEKLAGSIDELLQGAKVSGALSAGDSRSGATLEGSVRTQCTRPNLPWIPRIGTRSLSSSGWRFESRFR